MSQTSCDIIIPVFNKWELTKSCLESILRNTSIPHRIILIDNGSAPETSRFLSDFKTLRKNATLLRNQDNLGWVKAVNQGIGLSTNPYVCIMNNDTIVKTDGWLSRLIEIAECEKDIGLVNPRFEAKKDTTPDVPFIEIDFCRGYCVLVKRSVIERIGVLDESYGLGYYDDDDYSVRAIKAGFRCVRANSVFVEHLRDATFSELFKDDERRAHHERNKSLFYSRWGRRLRLVFIITKRVDKEKVSSVLFSLARKQHIIYLWNTASPISFDHINIRGRMFPKFFCGLGFALRLYLNKLKRASKQYDIVFVDDAKLNSRLSSIGPRIHYANIEENAAAIGTMVDSLSKAQL